MLTLGHVLEGDCDIEGGRLRTEPVGELIFNLGMPHLRDPMSSAITEPGLCRFVPKRNHPVSLRVQSRAGVERAAFLVMRVSDEPVARWELALARHDARSLRAGEPTGTKVESGALTLFDMLANTSIRKDPLRSKLVEVVADSEQAVRVSMVKLKTDHANAVVCGTKKATFQAYWALDHASEPVALVVDLDIQEFEKPASLLEAALDARLPTVASYLRPGERDIDQRDALADVSALGWPRAQPLLPSIETLLASPQPRVREAAGKTLADLIKLHPPLLDEYRAIVESGSPSERLLPALVVCGRGKWRDEASGKLKQAFVRHLQVRDPITLAGALEALARQQARSGDQEVLRHFESYLQHESPAVRSAALSGFLWATPAQPSADTDYALWARADRALQDPVAEVRATATRLLAQAVRGFPAHHGRLLSALHDPELAVGYVAARDFFWNRARAAPEVLRSVVQVMHVLSEDKTIDYDRSEAAKRWLTELASPTEPPASPYRGIYFSPTYTISEEFGGRMRMQGPSGLVFDVEQRRVFDMQARPDPERPGQAWLLLVGCLAGYGFQRITPEGAWFGPFPSAETDDMVRRASGYLRLPARPLKVAFADLARAPRTYHAWFLESEGEWLRAPDISTFAGAWLSLPASFEKLPGFGPLRISVAGIWRANPDPSKGIKLGPSGGGYGHLGLSPAELEVFRIKILD